MIVKLKKLSCLKEFVHTQFFTTKMFKTNKYNKYIYFFYQRDFEHIMNAKMINIANFT